MSWCRVCFEHDCGIDHGDNRRVRKRKLKIKRPPTPPPKEEKKEPTKKAPSHTQLKLF